ncbi:MAG: UTP--glucose-1-phosphate uridylyltransferase [Geminicoccaceae bacterium]|nr:MAG: UTP--glucose-1-phosphate uridylyltransferase [Geminicoccaceae bacterium]
MVSSVKKAVFPVAGLGTRMLPATKVLPKEMLPVVDKPILQYALEEAKAAGIEEFVFVTGRGKSILEDHFDRAYELFDTLERKQKTEALAELESWLPTAGTVVYTRQQQPLGLGHAVWCARHLIGNEPFVVSLVDDLILGDVPCTGELIQAHEQTGGNVVATMEVPLEHTSRYGILDPGKVEGRLVEAKAMVEKPEPEAAPSRYAVIGRYVLLPEIFDHLERQERGAGGEIQLTDAMARMLGAHPFHGYVFSGERHDCGDKLGYLEAIVAAASRRADLKAGLGDVLRRYV